MKRNTGNSGSFAIVETLETGKKLLSTVPQRWVNGKMLMWPDKKAGVLVKDHLSMPSPKWHHIPCILKRKSLKTFAEAEAETAEMSGYTNSDSNHPPPPKVVHTEGAAKKVLTRDVDFNEMMIYQFPNIPTVIGLMCGMPNTLQIIGQN